MVVGQCPFLHRTAKENDVVRNPEVLHDLDEYGALALFLLVAMTYINAISQRGVFDAMRVWLVDKGLGYRQLF
jgi:Na+/H+ antiporter NhaD/arsenite permease-like protein